MTPNKDYEEMLKEIREREMKERNNNEGFVILMILIGLWLIFKMLGA